MKVFTVMMLAKCKCGWGFLFRILVIALWGCGGE